MNMIQQLSSSCLSLDELETNSTQFLVREPHVLGPGYEYFTTSGNPICPLSNQCMMQKVFSGSALDLNVFADPSASDDDPHSPTLRGVAALALSAAAGCNGMTDTKSKTLPFTLPSNGNHPPDEDDQNRLKNKRILILIVEGLGYLSSHVTFRLLEGGYSVRITISDPYERFMNTKFFKKLTDDMRSRLDIVQVLPNHTPTLRGAVRGVRYVLHCGLYGIKCPGEAAKLNISSVQALFEAIHHSEKPSVKRVFLADPISSVFDFQDSVPLSGKFDESFWNVKVTPQTDPLVFAQISSEREAWRRKVIANVELVVILTSEMLGPPLTDEYSRSMELLYRLANKSRFSPFVPNLYFNFVDVRDVAEAFYILVSQGSFSDQRIIVSNDCYSLVQLGSIIHSIYPHLSSPHRSLPSVLSLFQYSFLSDLFSNYSLWSNLGVAKRVDTSQSKTVLCLQYRPFEKTVRDSIDYFMSIGDLPLRSRRRSKHIDTKFFPYISKEHNINQGFFSQQGSVGNSFSNRIDSSNIIFGKVFVLLSIIGASIIAGMILIRQKTTAKK